MSYVSSVLQPGERVIVRGRLHWIVYWHSLVLLLLAILLLLWAMATGFNETLTGIAAIVFAVLIAVSYVHAWFKRWTTEIAVTDRRVIFKRGFIRRYTMEINMDKVASVDVDQSILGRVLDYGAVRVIGSGGLQSGAAADPSRDPEYWDRVEHPLALRSAITAK